MAIHWRCAAGMLDIRLPSAGDAAIDREPEDQEQNEHRNEQEEQELRDPDRSARNAGETQQAGDQPDYQKHKSPAQHGVLLAPRSSAATSPPHETLAKTRRS